MTSTEKARPIHARFYNSLERVHVGMVEIPILGFLRIRGIQAEHAGVQWHGGPTFLELLEQGVADTERDLEKYGRVLILGASAGVSLGLNIFSFIRERKPDADLWVVGTNGWVRKGDLDELEYTAIKRPKSGPAPAFRDSVIYCHDVATPCLTDDSKQRISLVQPADDEVVPTENMRIEGVTIVPVPYKKHLGSIVCSAFQVPRIFDAMHTQYVRSQP